MLAVKEMNKRRSFSRLEVGLSLLGLAACLGAVGVGYRKKGNASEVISNKGVALIVHNHFGKIIYGTDRRMHLQYRNETLLMLASTALINHIGLLIPIKISQYNLGKSSNIRGEELRIFEAKSIFLKANMFWKQMGVKEDLLDRQCLVLNPYYLGKFIELTQGKTFDAKEEENIIRTVSTCLEALRQLQRDSADDPHLNLMTAFKSLSQATAKSNKTELVGGLFLGKQVGASFDMEAKSEGQFRDTVGISCEIEFDKEGTLKRILELFKEMRDIKLPQEFLNAERDCASPSGFVKANIETMKGGDYVVAIKSLLQVITNYIYSLPSHSQIIGPVNLGLANGNNLVRIWFLRADPKLIPQLRSMADNRRKLFEEHCTQATKGIPFSVYRQVSTRHLEQDNELVDNFYSSFKNPDG